MKRLLLFSLIIAMIFIASIAWSDIIHVPGDQPTIQAGIDAASDGDTVLVANGTYTGDGNKDLDFRGKAITVTSEDGADYCIIECQGDGRGFYFHSGETETSVVSGFTIRNGDGKNEHGGGIYCEHSSPIIMNNIIVRNKVILGGGGNGGGIYCKNSSPIIANSIIEKNEARHGGGIYCQSSSVTIINNIIRENHALEWNGGGIYCTSYPSSVITNNIILINQADRDGGGIHCDSSSPYIKNNLIVGNQVKASGGGICCYISFPVIANNTIIENKADDNGGGIACPLESDPTIQNTILWNDNPQEIYLKKSSSITITYSDIQGGWEGEGNIDVDPLFVDPDNDDYHLSDYSPCIGAGIMTPDVPDTDIEGNPRPNPLTSNPDMGAYENPLGPILPPIIERISPEIGQISGGDEVMIKGNYFQDSATVTIGGNPAIEVTVDSKTQITARIPPGEFGITDVAVINPDGQSSTLFRGFAYIPIYGDVSGDRTVSAYDAALILQYIVGIIDQFPATNPIGQAAQKYIAGEITITELDKILQSFGYPSVFKMLGYENKLLQNYPNPFNPDTWIPFKLAQDTPVTISIYDTKGQLVRTIVLGNRTAGIYTTKAKAAYWDGTDSLGQSVASGVYYYTLQAGDFTATRQMVILK